MALVLADRVLETTTTAGSGTITLAGAEPGYQSFSAVGDGNQTYYTITGDTEWEVGIGTYTASGTTLSRDSVLSSSNSGAKVTFSAGVKKVFVTYPSEKSVNFGVSGNISASSGVITDVGYPSAASDAATKLYVDTLAAQGITYHTPVKYEVPNTTGNLTATYNQPGGAGVGVSATLTNAGTLAAFVPDGVTASISDRVLVYNQTNGFENGVYTVTVVGNGSTAWVLTRATDADTYALKSPNGLGGGDAFYVTSGNTGAGETYLCNNSGVISFGSTAISFVQISAAQVYSAGNGLSLTNTVFSLASPVAVANGGTGTTATPTNGQLLIGNGSNFTLSTLTAGSGVSITNSAGSITLSATGLGGTVTAVTATGPLASSGGTTPDISIANSTGTGSVVLDQGATISSATITAALSASITTITGTSANITTVSGTTARFSSAAITQLSGTSAGITTVSGTTTTFSSGTITQFGATSATIATVSGTNVTYSNGNFTSATVTNASGTNLSYASATITTGNLTFSSTAQRITGDMSNATIANRLAFQTSTTNGATQIVTLPNGTGSTSGLLAYGGSDPANTNLAALVCVGGVSPEARVASNFNGTGTASPITFYISGSERMRLDTSGNLGIGGSANATARLDLIGTSRNRFDVSTSTVINTVTNAAANAYATLRIDSADYQFYTGGSEKVRIDSSGNVGIGTATTTNGNLTIQKASATTDGPVLTLWNSNANAGNTCGYLRFFSNTTVRAELSSVIDSSGPFAGNFVFKTGDNTLTERFRFGSAGQFGIGGANYGTSGQVLTSGGASAAPSWQTPTTVNNGTLTMNVSGTGLSGSASFTANQSGNSTFTVTSNATSANTLSTIVARDGSTGGFTCGDINAQRPASPTTGVIFFGNTGTKYLFFDGTNYVMPNGQLDVNGQRVLNAGNYNTYAVPSKNSTNWSTAPSVIGNVVGLMAWKNYDNNHVIFDASQGTAPNGTAVNNTNPQGNWTASYPTLMGWNGSNTYGVRVDSCRIADTVATSSSAIKSIQRGNGLYANGNSPVSITISSVTISKSVVNYLGTAPQSTGTFYSSQGYFVLTSATNLNFTANYNNVGPFGQYASWEIIEYV